MARLQSALRESGVLSLSDLDRLDTRAVTRAAGLSANAAAELKVEVFAEVYYCCEQSLPHIYLDV